MSTMQMRRLLLAAAAALLFDVAAVAQTDWSSGTIAYDGLGNITAMGQDVYVYDSAGRLVSGTANQEQSGGATARQEYSYDGYGNRLNVTTTGTSCVGRCAPGVTVDTATNRLSNSGATYDGAGHLKTVGAETYTYDGAEMVARVQDSSIDWQYVYTADEERVAIYTGQGNWRFTVRDAEQKVVREFTVYRGASATTWTWDRDHVFRDGVLLATLYPSGQRQQFHVDHLGSPRVVSDVNGIKTGTHAYYPFGDELNLTPAESLPERLKFTGHERDALGSNEPLDYMHARYYSPTMGRFLSVDPVLSKGAMRSPQLWNRYSYVGNNPLRYIDPTGKYICTGTDAQCKSFEDARQASLQSKRATDAVKTASNSYGDPHKDNGITVRFGDPGKGRAGSAAMHLEGAKDAAGNYTGAMQLVGTVTMRSGLSGTQLQAGVAHEGSHLADGQAFAASFTDGGLRWNAALNLTGRQTEMNAYAITAQIATMTNSTFPIDGGTFRPNMAPAAVSSVTENILRLTYDPGYLAGSASNWDLTPP